MSHEKHRKPQSKTTVSSNVDAESKVTTSRANDGSAIRRGLLSELQDADGMTDEPMGEEVIGDDGSPAGEMTGEPVPETDDADTPSKTGLNWKVVSKFLMNMYEVVAQTLGISLMVAMIVARWGGGATIQWVFGITAMLAVILSKTVFASDISDIYSEAKEQVDESRRRDVEELDEGNFEGVPQVFQRFLKYPTQEDYDQIKAEAERQRELLRNYSKPGKNNKGNGDKRA